MLYEVITLMDCPHMDSPFEVAVPDYAGYLKARTESK